MKKIITMAGALFMATTVAAQTNDTVIINNAKRVIIVTNDSMQQIKVKGKAGDEQFTYQNTIQLVDSNYVSTVDIGRDRWELLPTVQFGGKKEGSKPGDQLTSHFGIGFTAPTGCDDDVEVSTFRSWELFATIMQWEHFLDKSRHNILALGFGIDWRNYRMNGNRFFVKGPDDRVTTEEIPADASLKFSRIKVFSLTSRLSYTHYFGNGLSLGFGPVVNFNTYASIKTKYKQQGEEHKWVEKRIHQRPVTVDWMLDFITNDMFAFYVKYSPTDVLKDGGVKFRSLSFGIYL